MPRPPVPGLPSRQQILDFIASSATPAGKREIARAFGLQGNEKIQLKALLKDMADEGLIDSAPGRSFHKMGGVPKVTVLRIVDVGDDGQAVAVPEIWHAETPPPKLRVIEHGKRGRALGVGDRILARTEEAGKGWVAHPMKRLERGEEQVLGVLHKEGDKLWLKPVDKRERHELMVSDAGDAQVGDLVLAEKAGRPPRITARVTQRLGEPFAPRSFSLIAIHKHGIPDVFSEDTIAEALKVAKLPLGGEREDLRHLPIVAIDPADARDHDDAVWATADDDPANPGGFLAIVAIADVSFYVRPGSDLDREARRRGNSVYFPDRVVPMLPEELSADICSLKEGADRAALVCHLVIAADGTLKSWKFTRAVIRVAANIAYEDAQAAIDAGEGSLLEDALKPLWACWAALAKARDKRAPLELDLPERRVILDEKGRIMSVAPRERLDAHRLIEDYMIAANVAAAKALEAKKAPVMYRIHEPPSREKLVALKDYLDTFGISFALGQVIKPGTFNHLLEKVGERDERPQIMEQVLRTQTQAYYGPGNAGHFGLALGSYAHFTSPIRRYADLLVHRSLVGAYNLAPAASQTRLPAEDETAFVRIGEAISGAERRAMEAERETLDRYVAAYLSTKIGELVDTRITGVQPFGFFATVEGLGGDGLVPVSTLGREYFRYDEASHALVGDETGTRYTSGLKLKLRLAEANPISGALRFEIEGFEGSGPPQHRRGDRIAPRRGWPANIRHNGRRR
ncbi:MAG TPA: ribonuclease R [Sphingomonas sp.]|uniref:ribonuclease R n=1 Tax=Sphingomonas sp. TaxID=28214 RepID=UPI002CF32D21|nr:ribonuclease R [Sphingomonas sp.]HMI20747.1 ribonuclease R [Sphingomonas sp.]